MNIKKILKFYNQFIIKFKKNYINFCVMLRFKYALQMQPDKTPVKRDKIAMKGR